MLLRLSALDWPRLLYTRAAAVLLGVAAIFCACGFYTMHSSIYLDRLGSVGRATVSAIGAVSALGDLSLLICMFFFWLKCDVSSKPTRALWFFLLLLGFAYGSQIAYYAFVYIPAVRRRSLHPEEASEDSSPPDVEARSVLGVLGWTLIFGWSLLVLFVGLAFAFPKAMSSMFGSIAWALVLWPALLLIATAFFGIRSVFRIAMRRPAHRKLP